MCVNKVPKKSNFTVIDNSLINNREMSVNARFIMIYLLTKPENWTVNVKDLMNSTGLGKSTVYRAMKELKAMGFARIQEKRDDKGKFKGSEWVINEQPISCNGDFISPNPRNPNPRNPNPHFEHHSKYRDIVNTEYIVNTECEKSAHTHEEEILEVIEAEEVYPVEQVHHESEEESKSYMTIGGSTVTNPIEEVFEARYHQFENELKSKYGIAVYSEAAREFLELHKIKDWKNEMDMVGHFRHFVRKHHEKVSQVNANTPPTIEQRLESAHEVKQILKARRKAREQNGSGPWRTN